MLPSWINLDNSPSIILARLPLLENILYRTGFITPEQHKTHWRGTLYQDVTRGLPFSSGSIEKIYSSHMLEHLGRKQGERVLSECHRVLKKGGVFRIVVPDLAYYAKCYLQKISGPNGVGREAHDEFLWIVYGAYLKKGRPGANHRYMYDWPTLRIVLKQTGFDEVTLQQYQQGKDAEMCSLDNRAEDSLHIEAVK